MDRYDRRKALSRLLNKGVSAWTNDKMEEGWPRFRCTERAFCREQNLIISSFNGWFTGNSLPEKLDNIIQLAACPYFGIEVFEVIGMMPMDQIEPELREMIIGWPKLSSQKRKDFIAFWRDTIAESNEDQGDQATA